MFLRNLLLSCCVLMSSSAWAINCTQLYADLDSGTARFGLRQKVDACSCALSHDFDGDAGRSQENRVDQCKSLLGIGPVAVGQLRLEQLRQCQAGFNGRFEDGERWACVQLAAQSGANGEQIRACEGTTNENNDAARACIGAAAASRATGDQISACDAYEADTIHRCVAVVKSHTTAEQIRTCRGGFRDTGTSLSCVESAASHTTSEVIATCTDNDYYRNQAEAISCVRSAPAGVVVNLLQACGTHMRGEQINGRYASAICIEQSAVHNYTNEDVDAAAQINRRKGVADILADLGVTL